MQSVEIQDWGLIPYEEAWKKQESLMKYNLDAKFTTRLNEGLIHPHNVPTKHYFIFCEHPPVFTLGKNGKQQNVLISDQDREEQGIAFYHTNRGGDITFHGPGQIVGYPILDLEKFKTDIGLYLRNLEEVIIRTLLHYGIESTRSSGETGVWLDPDHPIKARKICAMGVRCSRWVTMHGFALNVNTELKYFNHIIPCGIQNKKVTSIQKELGNSIPLEEVKRKILNAFQDVFEINIPI